MARFQVHAFKRAKIEIVPLIDIMFFLLATFIMVSLSMTKNQGMSVHLPAASTANAQETPNTDKSVTLTVMENGEVFYNKEKVTMAQLPFKLQTLKVSEKDPKVIVNADASTNFKQVVAVMDEARKIGIAKIGITTDKK